MTTGEATGDAPDRSRRIAMQIADRRACFIVDDDADLRRVIAHSVRRAGLPIVECGGLGDVVAALRDGRPGLVFLDAGLADATASEVLEVLAEYECDAVVQMISGRSAADLERIAEDGEDLGLTMLPPLTKPFRSAAVAAALDSVTRRPEDVR
jgi:DNA-binding response OmpR family regulator